MPPQNRPRARSSVDHLFDLVESLEEDQLQSFLAELNSTPDTNIDVSSGVAYFEEQRRQHHKQHPLRPTPSFVNASPEPADWPRQKPNPVSGSQWRQSMRIVSAPYARHMSGGGATEPVSPPLTASPPASPPLPSSGLGVGMGARRSVTAPVGGKMEVRVEARAVEEEPSPVSPPRHSLLMADEEGEEEARSAFGGFSFGGGLEDGGVAAAHVVRGEYSPAASASSSSASPSSSAASSEKAEEQSRPVSPAQMMAVTPPPPEPQPRQPQQHQPPQQQQQTQQFPEFSRMGTMPLTTLHHTPLSFDIGPERPRTSAGLAPRAFRRVSRPVFLSPAGVGGADELAGRLSAFLFGGGPDAGAQQQQQQPFQRMPVVGGRREEEESGGLEALLKEPVASGRGRRTMFGKGKGEVEAEGPAVSGIFEVLTEG